MYIYINISRYYSLAFMCVLRRYLFSQMNKLFSPILRLLLDDARPLPLSLSLSLVRLATDGRTQMASSKTIYIGHRQSSLTYMAPYRSIYHHSSVRGGVQTSFFSSLNTFFFLSVFSPPFGLRLSSLSAIKKYKAKCFEGKERKVVKSTRVFVYLYKPFDCQKREIKYFFSFKNVLLYTV